MKDCANWTIDCHHERKKCDDCDEFLSHADQQAFWDEKNILSKKYDKKRERCVKKYWMAEFMEDYEGYTQEELFIECVRLRLNLKGGFYKPYRKFAETPEYIKLKEKYPTARW